jgi:transcription antitermination factor NusA-like protein
LFELEVPEIFNGAVEVKAIAREPGARSKVAVTALQTGVDPVGSCVGMRGVRIRNIVNELNGEKIDVVAWASDITEFIANALSPAKVLAVHMKEKEGTAKVVVPDRALSLAIGKEGQNARLAAKLTGWRIDIKSETEAAEEAEKLAAEMEEAAQQAQELDEARQAAAELLAQAETALDEEGPSLAQEEAIPSETPEGEVGAEEGEQEAVAEEEATVSDEKPEIAVATEEPAEAPQEAPVEEIPTPVAEEPVGETVAEEEATPEPSEEQESLDGPEEESLDFDFEDEDEENLEDSDKAREREAREKKARGRTLEYDERLGRVVSRKRHKSRGSRDWQDEDWDDDLDG